MIKGKQPKSHCKFTKEYLTKAESDNSEVSMYSMLYENYPTRSLMCKSYPYQYLKVFPLISVNVQILTNH